MAFPYASGLRLRSPEPPPTCVDGEPTVELIARMIDATSIESATSSENNPGDSTPTPFNLGEVQNDIVELTDRVEAAEVASTAAIAGVTTLLGQIRFGEASYLTGATELVVQLLSAGTWTVVITSVTTALNNLVLDPQVGNATSFRATFGAAGSNGKLSYIAIKE